MLQQNLMLINILEVGQIQKQVKLMLTVKMQYCNIAINDKASKSDLDDKVSIDGSNAMNANLNINNFKMTNLSLGTDSTDAVNNAQLDSLAISTGTYYHLRPSFKFYKDFGEFAELHLQVIFLTSIKIILAVLS